MTWFKVDDGLHSHRKAVRAGIPAMGLWVMAGSWCADHLTDGFIPDYMAARLDPDAEEHAQRLVDAGLWVPAEKAGDKGWQFHQWVEQQPTAESVMEKRNEAKERMRRVREQRQQSSSEPGPGSPESSTGSREVRANSPRTSEEVRLAPTRPDPTRPEVPTELQKPAAVAARSPTTQQPSFDDMPSPPPPPEPTAVDRAFGLARWWIETREKAGTPVVAEGRRGPLHILQTVIAPFAKVYSDDEIRQGLIDAKQSIPSKQQLDRVLAARRTGEPVANNQGRAGEGLGRRPAPPGRVTNTHKNVEVYKKRVV